MYYHDFSTEIVSSFFFEYNLLPKLLADFYHYMDQALVRGGPAFLNFFWSFKKSKSLCDMIEEYPNHLMNLSS